MKKYILIVLCLITTSSIAYSDIGKREGITIAGVVDETAPAFSSATINGTAAVVNFSEDLDDTALENLIDGDLVMTGSTTGAVDLESCTESSPGTLSCTAASTFVNGETVTLSSSDLTGDELCDGSDNCISSISSESVTNETPSESEYATPAFQEVVNNSDDAVDDAIATSGTFNVATGNSVLVFVANYTGGNAAVTSVSDVAGNTYARCGSAFNNSSATIEVWASYDVTGNANNTVTATFNTSAAYRRIIAIEVTNLASYDIQATNTSTSASLSTGTTASTAQADEYLVSFFYLADYYTGTPGANWTERFDGGTDYYLEDRVVSSIGTYEGTATMSGSNSYFGIITTHKAASL
jgi:hypothetical protein